MEIALALGVILLWGVWSFLAKIATSRLGIFETMIFSSFSYYLILAIAAFFWWKNPRFITSSIDWLLLITFGVIGFIPLWMFYLLLQKAPASIVVALTSVYPVVTALLSIAFLGEKLKLVHVLGIAAAVIAVFLLSL
jgi:transporter family protein